MESFSQTKQNLTVNSNKRSHERTSVGAGTVIEIQFKADRAYRLTGLVRDGSHGGCGVVAVTDLPIAKNQLCQIKMGGLGPISARVKWIKDLESNIIRFGLEYLL